MPKITEYQTKTRQEMTGNEYTVVSDLVERKTYKVNIKDYLEEIGDEVAGNGAISAAITAHEATYNHSDIFHDNRASLDAVSGVNTGDQDVSMFVTQDDIDEAIATIDYGNLVKENIGEVFVQAHPLSDDFSSYQDGLMDNGYEAGSQNPKWYGWDMVIESGRVSLVSGTYPGITATYEFKGSFYYEFEYSFETLDLSSAVVGDYVALYTYVDDISVIIYVTYTGSNQPLVEICYSDNNGDNERTVVNSTYGKIIVKRDISDMIYVYHVDGDSDMVLIHSLNSHYDEGYIYTYLDGENSLNGLVKFYIDNFILVDIDGSLEIIWSSDAPQPTDIIEGFGLIVDYTPKAQDFLSYSPTIGEYIPVNISRLINGYHEHSNINYLNNVDQYLATWATATFNGVILQQSLTLNGKFVEKINTITGSSPYIEANSGTILKWTLTNINNYPNVSYMQDGTSVLLVIFNPNAYTINWSSVWWQTDKGNAPTLNSSSVVPTSIVLYRIGTYIYGAKVGNIT